MALRGKVAIITGASSGIGAAMAEYFAKEGAFLSLSGRKKERLEAVAKRCQDKGSDVLTTLGDITDHSIRKTLVQKTKDKFGKIDTLVNNAGRIGFSPLSEENGDQYDELMNVNLRAPVFLTKITVPHLIETKGSVVNISSITAVQPGNALGVYCMTKCGLNMFTKVLARELGPQGVRVNAINAGFIPDTRLLYNVGFSDEEAKQVAASFEKAVPLGRNGTLEEVVKTALFLVSDNASFITGTELTADGGIALQSGF